MARAYYGIHVPNQHRHITNAAHNYIVDGPMQGIHHANVLFGHPHDQLTVVGEDTPELDSHMKQTGTLIGEVANEPSIDVTKQGKDLAHWTMRNLRYQPPQSIGPPPAINPPDQTAPLPSARPT